MTIKKVEEANKSKKPEIFKDVLMILCNPWLSSDLFCNGNGNEH